MLVVIDGTGEWSNKAYEENMKKSFMNRIINDSHHSPKKYFRGPSLTGIECGPIAFQVMNWIRQCLGQGAKPELFIAGYSRGGAVAIEVAGEIANIASVSRLFSDSPWTELNENIRCMALFDAVDRSYLDTQRIPDNVKVCFHAMRDPKAGSRRSFGNTGTEHRMPGRLIKKTFLCTHGAMGGLPWGGDHPTVVVGHQITIPLVKKTFAYNYAEDSINKELNSGGGLIDAFRDEASLPMFGTEITKSLLTEAEDRANSEEVWNWIQPNMMLTGMFSHSSYGASGSW